MCATSAYKKVKMHSKPSAGLTTQDSYNDVLVYNSTNNSKEFNINLSVDEADIGSDIYIYINAKKGGNVTITSGENVRKFEIRSYQIITLGVFNGEPIEIQIKYSENPGASLFVYGYQLDQDGYRGMLDALSDEQLQVTSYDTTSLSGHIDVIEDGLLFLTIPYAEGWSAEVDGEPCEIVSVQDAFMGLMLEKGSHDITITYAPAGVRAGILVSAVSVFAIALINIIPMIFIRKKKSDEPAEAENSAEAPAAEEPQAPVEEIIIPEELLEDNSSPEVTDD